MKNIFIILISFCAMAFTSCIATLQPLVTPENAIMDNRISGSWSREDVSYQITPFLQSELFKPTAAKQGKLTLAISREDSAEFKKMYLVTFTKNGWTYNMAAGLTKIDDQLYMDLTPLITDSGEPHVSSDPFQSTIDYLPGSTIAKLNIEGSKLSLQFLDGDFIKEQVQAGKMRLKHESNDLFSTFLITASTNEMHSFLSKYANDERIFTKTPVTLTRKG